jgi:hypothetical protein
MTSFAHAALADGVVVGRSAEAEALVAHCTEVGSVCVNAVEPVW